MARKTLPIYERYSRAGGHFLGYQVKIRRHGFPAVSKVFDKRGDAEAFAISTLRDMNTGSFTDRREAEATTFADALDDYEKEVTAQKRGKQQEGSIIRRLKERRLAAYALTNIKGKHIAEYRNEREKEGVSASTIRNELALISHVFTIARKEWAMDVQNPVSAIRKPKPGKARTRRLERIDANGMTEEAPLLMGAGMTAAAVWLVPLIRLALTTGMRKGELVTLEWAQIDKKKGLIHLSQTKNGDSRDVPISPAARAVLDGIARRNEDDGLFYPGASGRLTSVFRRACENAGIDSLNFHDLRHEAVSRFFEDGLDVMQVASISGHKTLAMLKRYTHLRATDLVDRLAEIHAAQ